MKKPLIGISCNAERHLIAGINPRLYHTLSDKYVNGIIKAGGIPVLIPNGLDHDSLKELADDLDGFLFSGGCDVDPNCYGKEKDGTVGDIWPIRDETELFLLKHVLEETEKPVFGICRGLQIMNVALGGTLFVDLENAGKKRHSLIDNPRGDFSHEIIVEDGTRLKGILKEETRVNSFHHQAIEQLGKGLVATAYSVDDRVIEAIEMPGERYILAVQWHPEELTDYEAYQRLFDEFLIQANKTKAA
ncbi:MAG: gamma-glutamyl-gamma-aminobutyrate hydrolase family protein [Erysipelotrichaceae bacterium]|nr:gamma-glutamyl-gamma-aminobutyrate hydrolase family protein [Erysipelotrichaceae bacterium]